MCEFEWDPAKAERNQRKHGISFDLASTVFQDRLAKSVPDADHGMLGERWLTLGNTQDGVLLVVSHTYIEIENDRTAVRIISARRATRKERRSYELKS